MVLWPQIERMINEKVAGNMELHQWFSQQSVLSHRIFTLFDAMDPMDFRRTLAMNPRT